VPFSTRTRWRAQADGVLLVVRHRRRSGSRDPGDRAAVQAPDRRDRLQRHRPTAIDRYYYYYGYDYEYRHRDREKRARSAAEARRP